MFLLERERKKITKNINNDIDLTEEDIKHLLKSEEDIRLGRVYTTEEVIKYLEQKCGFRY